ncbi:MAG: orotate phosphoribosyltransferase, partial [Pseudohongiellaceae bacterium]
RALIIDDVITAGTAIREAVEILATNGADLCGIAVAMDRQEKGTAEKSAIQEIEENYKVPVVSIITLKDIINYLEKAQNRQLSANLAAVQAYRESYGVS